MLLRATDIAKSFAGRELFREVSLEIAPGDRIGLLGANGSGKSTLARILAGEESADAGSVSSPRSVRVARLRQEVDPRRDRSVIQEVRSAFTVLDAIERELAAIEVEMEHCGRAGEEIPEALASRYDLARHAFEFGGGFEREARADAILEGLGFSAAARAKPLSSFSGGWLMRVELARLLLSAPDVLLLDEPTNHLDLPSIEWFETVMDAYRGGIVVITHDRALLRRQANRIAELSGGRLSLYRGGFDAWRSEQQQRADELEARARDQSRQIEATQHFIERFRSKATKARQVQSRIKALDRMERVEIPRASAARLRLQLPEPARAGEVVLELRGVVKRYGERSVYDGVDLQLRRGDRVALVGGNGAGKSTLLRIAAGVLAPDAGDRVLGHNTEVAFFAQHQIEVLDPARSALEELASVARSDDVPRLRAHLGAFLFSGDDVDKRVAVLSGGEKSRLALARMLLRPANFLVLDEPTNHLDVAACEVLEQALSTYPGTLLMISHDRDFIAAVATRVIEVRAGRLLESRAERERVVQAAAEALPALGAAEAPALPRAPGARPAKQERMQTRELAQQQARLRARAERRAGELETEIADLEVEVANAERQLGLPEVYRDGAAVREVEARLRSLRAALDVRFGEWEQLTLQLEG